MMKSTLKKKILTKNDIIKRAKLLYDRYHELFKDTSLDNDFCFLSCKRNENKNIISLFQNNKQLYCNIDNIYDCSFHTAIEPNFDNPSCYDQFKYLESFKSLMEFTIYVIESERESLNNNISNTNNNLEEKDVDKEMINEIMCHIDNNDSMSNTSTKNNSNNYNVNNSNNNTNINSNSISNSNINSNNNSNSNSNADKENNEENININLINNNNPTQITDEIIIENNSGISKIINIANYIQNKNNNLSEENKNNNNENVVFQSPNMNFKSYIISSIQDFNNLIKSTKFPDSNITPIEKIRHSSINVNNSFEPCSDLCYKNLLLCDNDLIEKAFKESLNRRFPPIYELLFIKFLQMLKYNPCSIHKLLKHVIDKDQNFNIECYEVYFHLINNKYKIQKIFNKNLLNINLKEKENLKKNITSRKLEEKNLKNKYLPYTPCAHFGNEVCDDSCPCAERDYCEVYCKCNKLLCTFSHTHIGCHCFKGDCVTNHCPCYVNAKECDPIICKNCNKVNSKCKNRQLYLNVQAKIIVGISKVAGWGLFANEPIKKDALIGEYKGELINEDITNKRDRFKIYENSTYMFTLDDEYTIDSRKIGNMLRYANHSKKNANSYPRVVFCAGHHRIGLFAKRHINQGEEIKFDYDGQNILSKQFPWINDEKEEKEKVEGYNGIKKGKRRKKLGFKTNNKFNKEKEKDKDKESDNSSSNNKESSNSLKKMELDNNINNNKSCVKSNRNSMKSFNSLSTKKISRFSKNKMIRIFNEDTKDNNKYNNDNDDLEEENNINKNTMSLLEDQKEEEKIVHKNSNINLGSNKSINENKKYYPLSAKMIAQTLLNHKRYFDKKSEEFLSKKSEENNKQYNSMQKIKISVNSFNKNNNDMFFKDKQIKLFESNDDLDNDNDITSVENGKVKIYDLGTIHLMINFENPIIADFSFFGPKNTDFFKKYEILKFQSKDILDEIKADFNKDLYGYLINGNFNRGHMILVRYLKFYEKRVYFCRNDDLKISIYIFGNGKIKDLIFQKCGIGLDENKLTFLIKNDSDNFY